MVGCSAISEVPNVNAQSITGTFGAPNIKQWSRIITAPCKKGCYNSWLIIALKCGLIFVTRVPDNKKHQHFQKSWWPLPATASSNDRRNKSQTAQAITSFYGCSLLWLLGRWEVCSHHKHSKETTLTIRQRNLQLQRLNFHSAKLSQKCACQWTFFWECRYSKLLVAINATSFYGSPANWQC